MLLTSAHIERCRRSPWGTPDHITHPALGIAFVSTPSHGGFVLDDVNNAKVPMAWREASFNGNALRGYYEEDCDACMVVLTFRDAFKGKQIAPAIAAFKGWIMPKLSPVDRAEALTIINGRAEG